jgi:hypothetical protein
VIDDLGDVRILEIDAQREMMRAANEGALIWPIEVNTHQGRPTGEGLTRKPQKTSRADFAFHGAA